MLMGLMATVGWESFFPRHCYGLTLGVSGVIITFLFSKLGRRSAPSLPDIGFEPEGGWRGAGADSCDAVEAGGPVLPVWECEMSCPAGWLAQNIGDAEF